MKRFEEPQFGQPCYTLLQLNLVVAFHFSYLAKNHVRFECW